MGKRQKIIFFGSAVLIIVAVLVANRVATICLEHMLHVLPEPLKITYKHMDVNTFRGRVVVYGAEVVNKVENSETARAKLYAEKLTVRNFGFWDYMLNGKMSIGKLELDRPKLIYYVSGEGDTDIQGVTQGNSIPPKISVDQFIVDNALVVIRDAITDSTLLETRGLKANFGNVIVDKTTMMRKRPLSYSGFDLSLDSLFFRLGPYENLKTASVAINKDQAKVERLRIYTKYSKNELLKKIQVERDYFDLTVDALTLQSIDFGYREDFTFFFKSPKTIFDKPVLKLYRNKLVPDDNTVKKLYGNMLRNLGFDLALNSVSLNNATIEYSEKVHLENPPGTIRFSNLHADISNLGNTYQVGEKTNLEIEAVFMKSTPIKANWYFDVNSANDNFVFKAEVGKLLAQDMNTFSGPNLKVLFEGELIKTYFTIDGNAHRSNVELRTKYEDFKVDLLEKEGKRKNKLLSAMVNLVIKHNSDKTADGFREGFKKDIERDPTKSVFNFLWLNAKEGLLDAMTVVAKK